MKKYLTIKNILLAVLVILVVGMAISLFTAYRSKGDNTLYKEVIKAKDETIMEIRAARKSDSLLILEKDKRIEDMNQRDSTIAAHEKENRLIIKQIENSLKNIPSRIASIAGSDDDIRKAFDDY